MLEIRFVPEAEADLLIAVEWYLQRSTRLATRFLEDLALALTRVARFPLSGPAVHRGLRQALLKDFPYRLLYRPEDQALLVFALLHQSREHISILSQRLHET